MVPQLTQLHTQAVLESLLDNGIVGVGENLELVDMSPQTSQLDILHLLSALNFIGILLLEESNLFHLLCDLGQFLLPVCGQNLACFLESLVGQVFKGKVAGGANGDTTTAGSNWHLSSLDDLRLEFGKNGIGIQVERVRLGGSLRRRLNFGGPGDSGGEGSDDALRPQLPGERPYDGLTTRHVEALLRGNSRSSILGWDISNIEKKLGGWFAMGSAPQKSRGPEAEDAEPLFEHHGF